MQKKSIYFILFITMFLYTFSAASNPGEISDIIDKKKITVKFNTSVENTFQIISKISEINIILDEEIPRSKIVQLEIEELSIKDTLNIIMKLYRLKYIELNSNTIIVYPDSKATLYSSNKTKIFQLKNIDSNTVASTLLSSIPTVRTFASAQLNTIIVTGNYEDVAETEKLINKLENLDIYEEKTIFLSYLKSEDAEVLLNQFKTVKNIFKSKSLNSITIRAKKSDIASIEALIKQVDIKPSQTLVDITLIDASQSFTDTLGINWKNSLTLNDINANNLKSIILPQTITATKSDSSAEILANPRLMIINNETAKIVIGERIPIVIGKPTGVSSTSSSVSSVPSVEYKDVGIQLEVVPTIHSDGEITIKLSLEVSTLGEKFTKTDYGEYPSFVTKNISTQIRLKSGNTAVFGGIINNEQRNIKELIPLLGDIPILGKMFFTRNDNTPKKSEIIMLVTPRVVNINNDDKLEDLNEIQLKNADNAKAVMDKFNR